MDKTSIIFLIKVGQTIVLEKISFHKSQTTKDLIESAGCNILYLPPYSPDLNPIEQKWSHKEQV